MVDNKNFKQVGTIFGMPLLIDLTDTVPEDHIRMIDQSQLALKKAFDASVRVDQVYDASIGMYRDRTAADDQYGRDIMREFGG